MNSQYIIQDNNKRKIQTEQSFPIFRRPVAKGSRWKLVRLISASKLNLKLKAPVCGEEQSQGDHVPEGPPASASICMDRRKRLFVAVGDLDEKRQSEEPLRP